MTTVTHYLTRADIDAIAEIKRLRESIGHRNVTDVEIMRAAASTGLRYDLETMRMVAEAFERREPCQRTTTSTTPTQHSGCAI